MDFFRVSTRETKNGFEVFPDFLVGRSKDLMVRGRSFYAIWDEAEGVWSTDEYDVQRLVDLELRAHAEKLKAEGTTASVKYLQSFGSNSWAQFRSFLNNISDNSKQLDEVLTFANSETKRTDYVSRRLPYALESGDYSAWDELVGTLYSVEERAKIEWAIGAIVSGEAKKIQKFLVLYGPPGTGKSTVLDVVEKLFAGYTTTFEAKALSSNNGSFATEVFRDNPLVAIQHDGDLSKIEDNARLNSIISHEDMTMNEKYKPSYTARVNAFLLMGTNKPVKISDAKSGIIRRLIDVHPTGVKIPINHYLTLIGKVDFELGAIAQHCLDVYRELGKNHYNGYRPTEMMLQTDVFYNFIEAHYDIFKEQDGCTLKQAYDLYKVFCADTGIEHVLPQFKVREELRNYFEEFRDRHTVDGHVVRSWYAGFTARPFKEPSKDTASFSLVLEETESLLDEVLAGQPAQGATTAGTPLQRWASVATTLSDIDTTNQHFVKVPPNHIVIDFDLKGDDGSKSLERNLEAASVWPATYAELSKSGSGVHLHYNYTGGDPQELNPLYSDGIEVKVYHGDASLRRRVSKCNSVPIADLNSGLPKREKKPVLQASTIQSEKGLRDLIARNMRKEIHPGTKPSIDFIKKILDDAYDSGMVYDVSDLQPKLIAFASQSSNKAFECLKIIQKMQFHSDKPEVAPVEENDEPLVFYDVEVYPNLFVICWKFAGAPNVIKMINPTQQDVETFIKHKLVGFNNRRYDNHIVYARYMGYNNEQLYRLSQKLINNDKSASFGEAYNLSYCDIWDFSSIKQSLKKFEIDLGILHMEMDLPWDQPVKDEDIPRIVEYCANDVIATEKTFEDRKGDFVARQILAELSGLSVNDSTPKHTSTIIFGKDRQPQKHFVYTDLSTEFPGYKYHMGKSEYKGEDPGEGGYVYAEPGMYSDVALLDVASMHPTSIEQLHLFGEYTERYSAIKEARMAIKRGDMEAAGELFEGRLKPYLKDKDGAKALSYALKIAINIVYGLTSARFENSFKDPRNKDNIVAKRGALFMIDLKYHVMNLGYTVAHIKTDSIKIPNADQFIIDEVTAFGKKYGYDFEHEATYDRLCLVNDAVYIARKAECMSDCWTAVGAQFQHPFVFKTMFSKEEVTFDDFCEARQVMQGSMFMDVNGELQHIGRIGRFVPVLKGGGRLVRVKDDKQFAVTRSKGYLWMEADVAKAMGDDLEIDMRYFDSLVADAYSAIENYGSPVEFINGIEEE
jgi:hypothetical protein